ncbi:hypothetical protein V7150_10190 [Neobacillus drentensis]|uniref:hypothetical protein n=1 Tax=Neobacillus drentensis TaxID=220684 RepID=UPI002FFF7FBF
MKKGLNGHIERVYGAETEEKERVWSIRKVYVTEIDETGYVWSRSKFLPDRIKKREIVNFNKVLG